MKKILVNYAAIGTNGSTNIQNKGYFEAQKLNAKTGLQFGFDEVEMWGKEKLPTSFIEKHKQHFSYSRGSGYWCWKPFILLETLKKLNKDDILMYSDSGCHFISSINPLLDLLEQSEKKVLCFEIVQPEIQWTKRDCFVKLNCDKSEFVNSEQIMSTWFLCKKNDFAEFILNEWYKIMSDFHMVADDFVSPSLTQNYKEFIEHRHDQSILSLICKLNKVEKVEDISQNGRPEKRKIPVIINHTRKRD